MQTIITLENADKSIIDAIKAVLKMRPDVSFKLKQNSSSTILNDLKQMQDDIKAGKLKTYSSAKEMHESILNA